LLNTPVAFFVFNRPETTQRVFGRIRSVQPRQLLVVADGPRDDRPGETERCALVRSLVQRGIDWPCDVRLNFSKKNLGCGLRMSTGLDWVFANVESAIILEDDCLPEPLFFDFCAELLARYRDEPRVGAISGDNFQRDDVTSGKGYYFSYYSHCWGWATWRRAWQSYDYHLEHWPEVRRTNWLKSHFGNGEEARYWENILNRTHRKEIDTWDYQWAFANWQNDAHTILPAVNLVTNIGFGPLATHTREMIPGISIVAGRQPWPLQHPVAIVRNVGADLYTYKSHFNPSIWSRSWRKFVRSV
jgi:hypothetical protein